MNAFMEYNSPNAQNRYLPNQDFLDISASQINLDSSLTSIKEFASATQVKGSRNDKELLNLNHIKNMTGNFKPGRNSSHQSNTVIRGYKKRTPSGASHYMNNILQNHLPLSQSIGAQTTVSQHMMMNPYSSQDDNSSVLKGGSSIITSMFKKQSNKISYFTPIPDTAKQKLQQSQKTRNPSLGQNTMRSMVNTSCYTTKKNHSAVRVDMRNIDKLQCLNENEIFRIFQARNTDLGLTYFDQQFLRFKDYCQKQCINRKLRLVDLGMGLNSAHELAQIISVNLNIAHVDLRKNNLGDKGAKILIKAIARSKSIVHLDLSSNSISAKGAKKVFKNILPNCSLISLKIGSIDSIQKNKIGHKGIIHCIALLQHSLFLQFLDLRGNLLSDSGIITLCEGLFQNKTLIHLCLANNDVTSYGMERLRDSLMTTNLKELDLSSNPLGNQGIEYLSHFLGHNNCVLEKLYVTDCKFFGPGSFSLFQGVKRNPFLRTLCVDKNDLKTRNTGYIISAIQHGISYLSMIRCNLGDEGGVSVAEGVSRSKSMKTLLLQYNSLSDESAKTFAETIGRPSSSLEYLDLSYNRINDAGGEFLALALAQNNSISKLNLKKNNLKFTTGQIFVESVKKNRQIQYLILEKNPIPINFLEEIQELLINNMIRAAQNKIPQYKTEVTQLKFEQANDYDKTVKDIQKSKDNHQLMLRDLKIKENLMQQTKDFEKERNDEVQLELRRVETKVESTISTNFDEEQKLKMVIIKKEKEMSTLNNWIKKYKDDQNAHEENMIEYQYQIQFKTKDYMNQINQAKKELIEAESKLGMVKENFQKLKKEYKELTDIDLLSPTDHNTQNDNSTPNNENMEMHGKNEKSKKHKKVKKPKK